MIKTTRLKTVQVPMNRTYDLSNQCDGVTQVFHLPVRVEKLDSHYVIFNGQIYKNDRNHTFYKISADGTTLTTFFDYPPTPGKSRALQFVKTEASEGQAPFATEEFVNGKVDELNARIDDEQVAREAADQSLNDRVDAEETVRTDADTNLQTQIDAIVAASDVKDVVGTKAELDAYDKSTLGDNDIIKVLADETQDDATTYYRFVKADDDFTLIGAQGPFYTKAETDNLLDGKQDELTAGENITIENNVISATGGGGKTYTGGTGITVDNVNDTISANDGVVEFTGKIDYYSASGQGGSYSGFRFDSNVSGGGDNFMTIEFPGDAVKVYDDVSGVTYALRPTEIINDTDWSALWQ